MSNCFPQCLDHVNLPFSVPAGGGGGGGEGGVEGNDREFASPAFEAQILT